TCRSNMRKTWPRKSAASRCFANWLTRRRRPRKTWTTPCAIATSLPASGAFPIATVSWGEPLRPRRPLSWRSRVPAFEGWRPMPARRFLVHRRPGRCRAALAMALVWAVATGHAPAREGGVSRAADGRGISVLSPAQVFPVDPAREVPAFELPPDPAEGVATAGGPVMDREGRVAPAPAPAPVAPSYDWRYDYAGYDPGPPGGVTLVKPIGARLAPLPGRTGLVRETQYWRYRRAGGPTLSVGGVTLDAPAWSSTAR